MAKYGFSKYLFYECLFEHRFALRFHKLGADDRNNYNRDNYYRNRDRSDSRGRPDYRNNYYREPSRERGRQWTSGYDQRQRSMDRYQRPYDNNYQQRPPQQQQFQQPQYQQKTDATTSINKWKCNTNESTAK